MQKIKKEDKRKPVRINEDAYKLLLREKELLGAKSISEVIIKLFEGRKDPRKEEILRALKKTEKLINSKFF